MDARPQATAAEPARAEPASTLRRALLALLALEALLFCWSFGQFFCGDSLYYLWYRVDSSADAWRLLTTPDRLHSYRPLNYIVFSWLLFPLFGLHPLPYHAVSLGAHLAVSVLVFLLLRELVSRPAAALAGLLFFGAHATNFYITYDVSFLPDFGSGFFYVAALLAYVRYARTRRLAWLATALGAFVTALLFKESAITAAVGVLVVDLLLRRTPHAALRMPHSSRPWFLPGLAVAPFFVLAGLYLAWTARIKGGLIYPQGVNQPYALTLAPDLLRLKLRYLAWFFNLPVEFARRGWTAYAAAVAMAPGLAWILWHAARALRRLWRELLLLAGWALIALLPVLFIAQQPMKHNLYMPLVAAAAGLALVIEHNARNTPTGLPLFYAHPGLLLLGLSVSAATALQVPGDSRLSWVGEGSRIARQSLEAVRRTYPELPRGATLYVMPTAVRGMSTWYFQGGGLFSLFYRDSTLKMRFADLGHALPKDFHSRSDFFLFHFHEGRLWDVTRQYKRDAADAASIRLLERMARAGVETEFNWAADDLPDNRDITAVLPLARSGQSRLALLMVAGTKVRLALPPVFPNSVLQVGATVAGPMKSGARGAIFFEDPQGQRTPLYLATLDAAPDGAHWWDTEVDLAPLAGRAGSIVLETAADQGADWFAWSRLRIIERTNAWYGETAAETDQRLPPREWRLLDRVDEVEVRFNRGEKYPSYDRFDTPNGKPHFLYAARAGHPGHFALVMIAGTSARYTLDVPAGASLETSAINLGEFGDGVRGRIHVEEGAGREMIFDELLPAHGTRWVQRSLPLHKWAGHKVTLAFEASSGPRGETIADWCAWSRLRIVARRD